MALAASFPAAGTVRVTVGSRTTRSSRQGAGTWNGIRLTPRGRVVLMLLSLAFLLAVVVLSGRITAEAGTSTVGSATASVVVERGDSLWQIATRIAPGQDPRDVITVIRDLNGLGETTVVAGQSIVVPVYGQGA